MLYLEDPCNNRLPFSIFVLPPRHNLVYDRRELISTHIQSRKRGCVEAGTKTATENVSGLNDIVPDVSRIQHSELCHYILAWHVPINLGRGHDRRTRPRQPGPADDVHCGQSITYLVLFVDSNEKACHDQGTGLI